MKKPILATILIVLTIILLISSMGGIANLQGFIFIPGLLFMLVMPILIIILSDSREEIVIGLKILFVKDVIYNKNELNRSHMAYDLLIKGMILGIVIVNTIALVSFLSRLDDPSAIGPIVALGILSIFYGAVIILFLLIIMMKVKMRIHKN